MEPHDYLDAITRDSALMTDAAARAGLDARVPTCPEWSVADLLGHTGHVQSWARLTVESRTAERIPWSAVPDPPTGPELLDWFREQGPALVAVLRATDPSTPVWTFDDDGTARFWYRRQSHEVAVHRVDAESAAGSITPIDTALAVDGVDEWLHLLPFRASGPIDGHGETVHLHSTDTDDALKGEWLATLEGETVSVDRVHAKGDVAARATAADLELFLWGRVPVSDLEVFGDVALLERFRALMRP
jgi:uncharacterized protein (TIGR03083 family)